MQAIYKIDCKKGRIWRQIIVHPPIANSAVGNYSISGKTWSPAIQQE